jgi:hypothetical protein
VPNGVLARAPIFLPWQNNIPVQRKIILSAVKKKSPNISSEELA